MSALESVTIESHHYPTYPDLRVLVQEARNLSKLALFVGEYCEVSLNYKLLAITEALTGDADLVELGLKDCLSLRSLFISPEYATGSSKDYDRNDKERLGYASDTDNVHLYDWYGV